MFSNCVSVWNLVFWSFENENKKENKNKNKIEIWKWNEKKNHFDNKNLTILWARHIDINHRGEEFASISINDSAL